MTWPPGARVVVLLVWLAYAVASNLWIYPLFWTVLPTGIALYLRIARYPWRVVLIFVVPITLLTTFAQAVSASLEAPVWVAFSIYLVACGLFSVVVADSRETIARVPGWLLGEPLATRLVGARFAESVEAANATVHRINAGDDPSGSRAEIRRIANGARRESRRDGTWQEAWATHATWLEGLADLLETEPTDDEFRHLNQLVIEANEAERLAIERATALDPAETSR
ncbi:MAG: hypothetical protein QOC97_475 [Chloroflexota bacterium]|jgi:hypothetical protein|nr:hypothetical protein [Chloroflexota bacterium]